RVQGKQLGELAVGFGLPSGAKSAGDEKRPGFLVEWVQAQRGVCLWPGFIPFATSGQDLGQIEAVFPVPRIDLDRAPQVGDRLLGPANLLRKLRGERQGDLACWPDAEGGV